MVFYMMFQDKHPFVIIIESRRYGFSYDVPGKFCNTSFILKRLHTHSNEPLIDQLVKYNANLSNILISLTKHINFELDGLLPNIDM